MSDPLIHRDDLDMDTVTDIEKFFAEKFPGMKVVFAGDAPGELPEGASESIAAIEAAHELSLAHGACIDCGSKMPNYPLLGVEFPDEWEPAKDWAWFTNQDGEQCPECDAKEQSQ